MYIVYGIPNCNTVKKAITWLKQNEIAFEFHDYKKKGITEGQLESWTKQLNYELLINKKGTTWKNLDKQIQSSIEDKKTAIALMMEKTSIIKRPIITRSDKIITLGFDETTYKESFLKN